MLNGKLAGVVFGGIFIAATSAGTWAAYSYSYEAAMSAASAPDPQTPTSNADAKGDRLTAAIETRPVAIQTILPPTDAAPQADAAPASYSVASLASTAVDLPKSRVEPRIELRKPVAAAPAPAPDKSEADKQKRAEQQKLLIDDAQIGALRTRLKLTPTQEEFWPAVEVTLRDVVRSHARKSRSARIAPPIDVNSAEVQQLIAAAVPLIMRLSEDQKREVRALARIIGLETVAARI